MIAILLPLGLAFIMLSIGLGLRVADFTRVFRQPLALGAGLVNQLVLLPLVGAALVMVYDGPAVFALGLMALAACPGGITSNLLTVLAGGNAALSVSMTAISSLVGIVSVPLILGLSQGLLMGEAEAIRLPLGQILGGVFGVTGVPIALGMLLNHVAPRLTERIRPAARGLATGVFALIVVGAFVGQRETMMAHAADLGPVVLALNLGTMALGLLTARLLRLSFADTVAIAMETGLQNAALAIFIATSLLGRPDMVVPAILYALTMNLSAAALIAGARAYARRAQTRSAA
ncbi:bile acid:sodium symporter family protein [Roseospira marina]|uniref:Bile acid:sodium symporter family protein n=1 Tax=Roseospira marina TaxID=140057 RepID=A0A5M6ID34_9PROT|nr:bile acid:sodium symporter family protein [Roseospira marina]KAA5606191.1 bile acid:sodium symporter family protein [Roseospira marina]MBB4314336.1 BASS family bile acid:Na+ symporter [Roseospira marina]MBB5087496.1 BASS family bile acid:Na+ symporter [Roseospira marina]